MEKLFFRVLHRILFDVATRTLKKFKPRIIAITGSMGKTSTRMAIFHVLNKRFDVRESIQNYNNERGVPLTIINEKNGGKSIFKWAGAIIRGYKKLWSSHTQYPEILVTELGIDGPGDMDYLLRIVSPEIGVLTGVGSAHLEFFSSREQLAEEKVKVLEALPGNGLAIVNADNTLSYRNRNKTSAKVVTYGFRENADIRVSDVHTVFHAINDTESERELEADGYPVGVTFKVMYQGSTVPFSVPRILGQHQILPLLPAIACGVYFGMNLVDISESLKTYKPPKSRMNLIQGLKHSLIIDDTYNASPEAATEGLKSLADTKTEGRKIAVIGDMLELGAETEEGHRKIGKIAAKSCDLLVAFGERSQFIADEALKSGMSHDRVFHFIDDQRKIEQLLQNELRKGDIVYVKGSQGMRMERVVEMLMAEPQRARDLLTRQDQSWKNKA